MNPLISLLHRETPELSVEYRKITPVFVANVWHFSITAAEIINIPKSWRGQDNRVLQGMLQKCVTIKLCVTVAVVPKQNCSWSKNVH